MLEETILGFFPMLRQTAQTFEVTAATVLTFEAIARHGGVYKDKVRKQQLNEVNGQRKIVRMLSKKIVQSVNKSVM